MTALFDLGRRVLPLVCLGSLLQVGLGVETETLVDRAESAGWLGVAQALERGADPNRTQSDGMSALHWAVYHENLEVARRLLENGAQVDACNDYGVSPLGLACLNGNADLVRLLLDAGTSPEPLPEGLEAPLIVAARVGRPEVIEALMDAGAAVDVRGGKGQAPIHWAAAEGHAEAVGLLIAKGADPSVTLSNGFTPLLFAAREGQIEASRVLLEAGVDVNAPYEPERRPGQGPTQGSTALIMAIENGHFELAATLLDAGADPNDQRSGFTPLHNLTWVRRPNFGDDASGNPAPIGSGRFSSLALAEYLVTHGADVNARLKRGSARAARLSTKGMTPFLLASDKADLPYMKLLVELGADPFLGNAEHTTPIQAAAGLGTFAPGEEAGNEAESLAAVRWLLDLGADINHVNDRGETAMHGAAYASFPEMARFLVENGAAVHVWHQKNTYGWTPLIIAQGYRPGNFKPETETIAAISGLLLAQGIQPPPPPSKKGDGW